MSQQIVLALFTAGDHCAPVSTPYAPHIVLVGQAQGIVHGANGLFFSEGGLLVSEVHLAGQVGSGFAPFAYDFRFFSQPQRAASAAAAATLQGIVDQLGASAALPACANLVPAVAGVLQDGSIELYHYMQQGEPGAIFMQYHRQPYPDPANQWQALSEALLQGYPKLTQAWPLFNDDCWYTKWLPAMEIERKFTFKGIPDTWRLNNLLYQEMLAGKIAGFVPELDREFQVFDYESHIFDVLGADEERGYISFIPQADGRMTVKRKWFKENAEIRRETVAGNVELRFDQIAAHVAGMTDAPVKRLPPFRRKRFDVNFESLATGNIYGVYFDICRTVEPAHAFSQCEVEYCRSRTFAPLRGVMEEFEVVADYTRQFLVRHQIGFEHDTFSKLDFVRQADKLAA
ncbi:MAG: hypothetical protein V4754_22040 [Pseudomonadota bacterium]